MKSWLYILAVSLLAVSCMGFNETDPSALNIPQVKNLKVNDNGGSLKFTLSANVSKDETARIDECGFYIGKDKNMTDVERLPSVIAGDTFTSEITIREYEETFYVCSFVTNGLEAGEFCSDPLKVEIGALEKYIKFQTPAVISYDKVAEKLVVGLSCEPKKGVEVTEWGLCYGDSQTLSVKDSKIVDPDMKDKKITAEFNDVAPGSSLYVRAYVYDGDVLAYGSAVQVHAYDVPTVEICDVSEITAEGASVAACVADDCGLDIIERGIVYVKGDKEPDKSTGKSVVSGTVGDYVATLTGLSPNTLYAVRAYAENERGVTYSPDKLTFTTLVALPQVETMSATSVELYSATLNAKIKDNGGGKVSERGFYISKTSDVDPATSNRMVYKGSFSTYSMSLKDLERSTEYHYRAFVVNEAGESLGNVMSFTTKENSNVKHALTLEDGTYVYLTGVVVAKTRRGFLMSDEDANMLYAYRGSDWDGMVDIGDYVKAAGPIITYNNNRELTLESVSVEGSGSIPKTDVYNLTSGSIGSFVAASHTPCKVKATGQVVKDGYYYNILLGTDYAVSPVFPVVDLEPYVGQNVTLEGYYLWTTISTDGAKQIVSIAVTDVVTDLNLNGKTANSYIVSHAGTYQFDPVKGNGTASVGSVASVEVLWESFGTDVKPAVGDLIKSVEYKNSHIVIRTPDVFCEGNAVIAAMNSSGKILWSWHIWLTDMPQECVYANNAGTMMDRNLGATSATPGDFTALGLLYQWGRKDPFLGTGSPDSGQRAASTGKDYTPRVLADSYNGTIDYTVQNPTTLIYNNVVGTNWDWYYTGNEYSDETRWQKNKTIYDPCPPGWRVPEGGSSGVWSKAGFRKQKYDHTNNGMLFGSGFSNPESWYPATCEYFADGYLYKLSTRTAMWSITTYNWEQNWNYDKQHSAYSFSFSYSTYNYDDYDGDPAGDTELDNSFYTFRSCALPVRCIKE